eukprot:COSAG06_NODE_3721_length_4976_cov_3.131232_2_plen_249_part_00
MKGSIDANARLDADGRHRIDRALDLPRLLISRGGGATTARGRLARERDRRPLGVAAGWASWAHALGSGQTACGALCISMGNSQAALVRAVDSDRHSGLPPAVVSPKNDATAPVTPTGDTDFVLPSPISVTEVAKISSTQSFVATGAASCLLVAWCFSRFKVSGPNEVRSGGRFVIIQSRIQCPVASVFPHAPKVGGMYHSTHAMTILSYAQDFDDLVHRMRRSLYAQDSDVAGKLTSRETAFTSRTRN